MLVEKEIISPGSYCYIDQKTGLPRMLDVTPEMTKYWHEKGSEMISLGLPIPVPYEHDFEQHPMTPKEALLNNAGEVKEYRLKDNVLFGVVDVKDGEVEKKIKNQSLRWTSPWFNSFTDGGGRQWNNVISHLALTTRPRITKQASFPSIAAALSLATVTESKIDAPVVGGGYCLSKAVKLVKHKRSNRLRPLYPMAFSLATGGIKFAEDDDVKPLKKKDKGKSDSSGSDGPPKPKPKSDSSSSDPSSKPKGPSKPKEGGGDDDSDSESDDYEGGGEEFTFDDDSEDSEESGGLTPFGGGDKLGDRAGDLRMEEILADLLNALGIFMPENVGEHEFKRALYEASMGKIRELTSKAQMGDMSNPGMPGAQPPNTPKPLGARAGGGQQTNPILQQEQQPMYMSLDDINKITDPTMKNIALSMHSENEKLRAEMEVNKKVSNSLREKTLREATATRDSRILLLSKRSPSAKADLEAMKALPSMALSMGESGEVIDPMSSTLSLLEKGLADIPTLLKTDAAALSVQAHPTDGEMTQDEIDKISDSYARMMGATPEKRAS
jgi:hypothetical protein